MLWKLITFILFSFISCCGKANPQVMLECTNSTTTAESCCFYMTDDYQYQCMSFPGVVEGMAKFDNFQVRCSETNYTTQTLLSRSCGAANPEKLDDCSNSSANDTSCCFYEVGEIKRCYNVGNKFNGNVKFNGFSVTCFANSLRIEIALFLILIVLAI
jgi:hypothetical protein